MKSHHRKWVSVFVFCAVLFRLPGGRSAYGASDTLKAAEWVVTGDAVEDPSNDRPGDHGHALRIPPGGSAKWIARKNDGSGKVVMWVVDDLSKPADPKARSVGPRWGLLDESGHMLVTGVFYAPYLTGDTIYSTSAFDGGSYFSKIQFSSLRRAEGWHKWTFDFDVDKGLSIFLDDSKKAKFDWNLTQMRGFNGVIALGDTVKGGQTIWVSGATAELGPVARATPTGEASVDASIFQVPATDPLEIHPVELLPEVRGQHPRLLFTQKDIPHLVMVAQGPGKPLYEQLLKYLPSCNPPTSNAYLTNPTDAQREGAWRLPTVALHFVLTHQMRSLVKASDYLAVLCKQPHWELGGEEDSGMGAANIMVGVALAYDWLYNDLDPQLREMVRTKLLLQARRMYYYGHLQKHGGDNSHYWQQDTQNNHRWHRDGGLALAVLAIADGQSDDQWLLARLEEELELVAKWLPPDGSCHESSTYQAFGMPYLGMAFDAGSRCLIGPRLLQNPYFENMPMFRVQSMLPGFGDSFCYGDTGGGTGFINSFCYRCTSLFEEPDLQAGLNTLYKVHPDAFAYGWYSLIWYDPAMNTGSLNNVFKRKFFPDLGMTFLRDGWKTENVGMMFKCCPYGGATLNAYRNQNQFHYINVAHDDPDANMFVLYANGKVLADDDRYAARKLTSSHNTILVDGKGQIGEGQGFTQPVGTDMTSMAFVTADQLEGPIAACEGEAGNAYIGLKMYRRGIYWVEHRYIMVLDQIDADQDRDLTWLIQGKGVGIIDSGTGHYHLGPDATGCDFTVLADVTPQAVVAVSTAEDRGKSLGYQQLQLKAHTSHWRLVTILDPWDSHPVEKWFPAKTDGTIEIQVDCGGIRDQWAWTPAVTRAASDIRCTQAGKAFFSLQPLVH
jgi:hypothetical protein